MQISSDIKNSFGSYKFGEEIFLIDTYIVIVMGINVLMSTRQHQLRENGLFESKLLNRSDPPPM